MKIVMFTDCYYPRINGVTISVKSYSECLEKLGHQVLIVSCNFEDTENDDTSGACYYDEVNDDYPNLTVLRVPTSKLFFSEEDRLIRVEYWKNVEQELVKFSPDIVHMHSEFGAGYLAKKYAKKYNVPLVYTFHTMWEDYVSNYIKFLPSAVSKYIVRKLLHFYIKRAKLILCPTARVKKIVTDYDPSANYVIFPTGIPDFNANLPKEIEENLNQKMKTLIPNYESKKILLYAGRIAKEKNIDFLMKVFKKLSQDNDDVIFVLVGGGPAEDKLKALASEMNLEDKVFFLGYHPRQELTYFYKLAYMFVFASLTETQGLVTIEAMSAGTPVVAIGEMGTLDVMQGDNGGFMVKNNLDEFYERVCLLLENQELYDLKCKEALEWAQKWSIEELSQKLVKHYENLLSVN